MLPKNMPFKANVRTHMRFLMSSYDNDLLSSTQQNYVPCQHFEVALSTRKKKSKWEKEKIMQLPYST